MIDEKALSLANLDGNVASRVQEAELFSKRFGSFAKSDYEVLMFTAFLDSLQTPARDYEISIALGITESKVRSLRVKSQLLYPRKLEWVESLAESIAHGYYDRKTRLITVTLENPSIQNLLKNKIEERFGTVGLSSNSKQLVLPMESFLLLAALAEEDEASAIARLNNALRNESSKLQKIEKKGFKDRFLSDISDIPSFLGTLASVYAKGKPILDALLQNFQ